MEVKHDIVHGIVLDQPAELFLGRKGLQDRADLAPEMLHERRQERRLTVHEEVAVIFPGEHLVPGDNGILSHRVDLIDLADHLGPAPGRERPEFLLNHPEGKRPTACLLDLPPMGVGVEAVITDGDLSFIRNMGCHPSALGHQEMQMGVGIHPVPKCLTGRDDPKHHLAPRDYLKILLRIWLLSLWVWTRPFSTSGLAAPQGWAGASRSAT